MEGIPAPTRALNAVAAFERAIRVSGRAELFPRTLEAIGQLQACVDDEFDVLNSSCRRYRSAEEVAQHKRLRAALAYQHERAKLRAAELAEACAPKSRGEVPSIWFVRVGLSNPLVSSSQMREFCRNLTLDGERPISRTYIGAARDAFAEILKKLRSEQVAKSIADAPAGRSDTVGPIFICHLHDEASMRFKSYGRVEPGMVAALGRTVEPFSRGRVSKVQDDLIHVRFQDRTGRTVDLEWFSELQALETKDARTIATALTSACGATLDAVAAGLQLHPSCPTRARVVHILVGDAIGTNEAAAKRMLAYFKSARHRLPIDYSLVVFRCAAHQCNLVVLVAIAESLVSKPADANALCGTCVRLYKYLMVLCLPQFEAALRRYVVDNVTLHEDSDSLETREFQRQSQKIAALYGELVLPDRLLAMYNRDMKRPQHIHDGGLTIEETRAAFYDVIYRCLFIVDEKPVSTRMFTFTDCCWALLRFVLLGIPLDVFSVDTLKLSDDGSKRLKAVRAFLSDVQTAPLLRRVGLSLRLTRLAMSISCQKEDAAKGHGPPLLRLCRAEVQTRTGGAD